MSKLTINLTDIDEEQGTGFVLLPKGSYNVKIIKTNAGKSKSGYDKISVTYRIIEGEHKNLHIFEDISLHPKILGRFKHFLHVLGEEYDGNLNIDTDDWIQKILTIALDLEEYTDKTGKLRVINKVKGHNKIEEKEIELKQINDKEEVPF